MRVVLLSKTGRFCREAQEIARGRWPQLDIAEGFVGDPRPPCLTEPGDLLISFLSPWIVTAEELARFSIAINFHPGSVDYPGTGCYNFALYEDAAEFGATCHHMLPKVDTGPVILERRFPIVANDTVESLKLRTMEVMLGMFHEIASTIASDGELPCASIHWTRRAYLKREMEALKRLTSDMPADEQARRIRATIYPGFPGPYLEHPCGRRDHIAMPERAAVA